MEQFDPRQDEYIVKAAEFAQPILIHLRQLIHDAAPEIQETMKWNMPFFDHKGPICHIAAFKQHCTFGLWKGALLPDPQDLLEKSNSMGQLRSITSLADLPSDEILMQFIREAVELNKQGIKLIKPKNTTKLPLVIPDYFAAVLREYPQAETQFNACSHSHKKEYVAWITEAKTEATRQKRMLTAVEWLSQGKSRHWKHQ